MAYATYDDLLTAFSETEMLLVSDRNNYGVPDDTVINEALSFADEMIDGYLRERYSLPLSNIPRNLVGIACDIARYRLYQNQPTELVSMRYEAALLWLKDIARGLFSLDVTGISSTPSPVSYSTPTAIFTDLVW